MGFVTALQWIRVFLVLQASRLFGPMIEIIISMIKNLIVFGALLLLIMFTYVFIGRLFFSNCDDFQSYAKGFLFLFQAVLGSFNFKFTQNKTVYVGKSLSYIYLGSYLVLFNITLLNFLIAILSDIFNSLKPKSKQLYLTKIIKINQVLSDNPYYSCLVSAPPPFNIVILPFLPLLLLKKNKKLNNALMYYCYIPTMLLAIVSFIIFGIVSLPFAYIVLLRTQFVSVLKSLKMKLKNACCEVFTLIMFLIFGIVYVFVLIVIDTVYYTIDLFDTKVYYKNPIDLQEYNGYDIIEPKLFDILIKSIKEYKSERIELKAIVYIIKEKLNVESHINKLLFCFDPRTEGNKKEINREETKDIYSSSIKNTIKEQTTQRNINEDFSYLDSSNENEDQFDDKYDIHTANSRYILDQFNAVKRFLVANSITVVKHLENSSVDTSFYSPHIIKPQREISKVWNFGKNSPNPMSKCKFR